MRRLLLVPLLALTVLPSQRSDAQIIRSGRFSIRDPQLWVSGGAGLLQGWTIADGTTGVRWRFGDAVQYGGAIEKTVSGGATLGIRATTARMPLDYIPFDTNLPATQADATVSQAFAMIHFSSGRGFHSVFELGAGATLYSGFRERGTGVKLPPDSPDTDFSFVLGYGLGYTVSRTLQVDVVQDLATSLHQKSGLSAGDDSSVRISGTRLVARLGFGG